MITLLLVKDALRSRGETEKEYEVINGVGFFVLDPNDLAYLKQAKVPFQIVKSFTNYYRSLL